MDTAGLFLSDRTKEAEKTAPSGPTQTCPGGRTHPSAAQIWGSDGSARTRADRARILPWSTCHRPASMRLLQRDASARVSASLVASSQSACALGAPSSPSMPATASTPAWRADWAAARWHSWRPLDARPLAPLKGGHNGAAATSLHRHSPAAATAQPPQPSHGVLEEGQA
jgi:hypothetical protein